MERKYSLASTDCVEWTYTMRRDMQEIIPGLFLGPYSAAVKSKRDNLLERHISHIVCIRDELEAHFIRPNFPGTFRYLVLDIADTLSENIIQHFTKVKDFLDECLSSGGNALVHGNAGISRSSALVIAYIMERLRLSYREAFFKVQQKRFCINPNERFSQQLKEWEPIYRAKFCTGNANSSSLSAGVLKRSFEEIESESQTTMDESL
ncbi:hypothetical protein CHUAL_004305 [Chamberlinius hualienensis]